MKQALLIIDYIESCCFEEYRDPQLNFELSRVRNMAYTLENLLSFYRAHGRGEIIWIASCSWVKGHVHANIERFYAEQPEAENYSHTVDGNNFYYVRPEKDERIFQKNMYSAFSGTQGRLETYLQHQKIERLLITGIYSTGGVNATICEAFHRGYALTILRDCVETFDDPDKQTFQRYLLDDWANMYGNVIHSSEYIKNAFS
jgi:nicotinamidase-related amidase